MTTEQVSADGGELPRKRGRKKKINTLIVSVRVPVDVYDRYCQVANRADVPVRSVLRHILSLHAPSTYGE